MPTQEFWQLSEVSDEHLLQNLSGLLAAGARSEAHIVAHLAEVEERRLHLQAAASSLFAYCLRRIGLSESEAFHRITAARLARKFPVIFGLLEARAIHLSALRVLRDHLTSDNHRELLAAASRKSTKEVEHLVAALAPRPDVPAQIRRLPAPRPRALPSPKEAGEPLAVMPFVAPDAVPVVAVLVAPPLPAPKAPRALEPLSPARYLLRLSVGQETKEKLERARDLMSHSNPSCELALVLEKALDLLLEKLERQRFAQTKRRRRAAKVPRERPLPRVETTDETATIIDAASESEPLSRRTHREHIPNEIRRAVALRDGFQCTYVDTAGRRCGSRTFLQLHHEQPHALGGPSTFENLRLLCGAHNRLVAECDFGRAHQARFTAHTGPGSRGRMRGEVIS